MKIIERQLRKTVFLILTIDRVNPIQKNSSENEHYTMPITVVIILKKMKFKK